MCIMLLSNRLKAVAEFVRRGARVADIGSDHAKLPIYLVGEGFAEYALASDVNEGPAERSRKAVLRSGLEDRISVSVSYGLDGIETFAPTDIVIAGMGGELISEIIDRSDYPENHNVLLILQPMTKAAHLREYLYSDGFDIVDEDFVLDGKLYQIIAARYSGVFRTVPEEYLLIGERNLEKKTDLLKMHIDGILAAIEKRVNGLAVSGKDFSEEKELYGRIKAIRESIYEDGN